MACQIAVANRKGGVGKSTIAVMLAQGFAVWGQKRVLVVDLDAQCNSSLILIGGRNWLDARKRDISIADYFYDLYDGNMPQAKNYIVPSASDLVNGNLRPPPIALLPGSLLLDDVQGELFLKESRLSGDPTVVGKRLRNRIENLLRRFEHEFDLVVYDCAPSLSFAVLSALKIADKVLVPFRPDYISQFAVDRVAMLIENCHSMEALAPIPFDERRYITIANCVRSQNGGGSLENAGADRIMVEELSIVHPTMRTQLPQSDAIANAFDWQSSRRTIDAKYGPDTAAIRMFFEEFAALIRS